MSKHTPGPWEVVNLDHSIVVRTESPNKTKYGASRYAAIGGFDRADPEQLAEAIANARLIAAAPDLLKALEYCRQKIAYMTTHGEWYSPAKAIEMADAAIAKAKGKV